MLAGLFDAGSRSICPADAILLTISMFDRSLIPSALVMYILGRSPIQLVKSKCLPILLYSLEACPLTKTDLKSLDFVINNFYEAFSNK